MTPKAQKSRRTVGLLPLWSAIALIAINIGSLYFIIDLLSYDEIVGYLNDGALKSCGPRRLAYFLFSTTLSNMLCPVVAVLREILSK